MRESDALPEPNSIFSNPEAPSHNFPSSSASAWGGVLPDPPSFKGKLFAELSHSQLEGFNPSVFRYDIHSGAKLEYQVENLLLACVFFAAEPYFEAFNNSRKARKILGKEQGSDCRSYFGLHDREQYYAKVEDFEGESCAVCDDIWFPPRRKKRRNADSRLSDCKSEATRSLRNTNRRNSSSLLYRQADSGGRDSVTPTTRKPRHRRGDEATLPEKKGGIIKESSSLKAENPSFFGDSGPKEAGNPSVEQNELIAASKPPSSATYSFFNPRTGALEASFPPQTCQDTFHLPQKSSFIIENSVRNSPRNSKILPNSSFPPHETSATSFSRWETEDFEAQNVRRLPNADAELVSSLFFLIKELFHALPTGFYGSLLSIPFLDLKKYRGLQSFHSLSDAKKISMKQRLPSNSSNSDSFLPIYHGNPSVSQLPILPPGKRALSMEEYSEDYLPNPDLQSDIINTVCSSLYYLANCNTHDKKLHSQGTELNSQPSQSASLSAVSSRLDESKSLLAHFYDDATRLNAVYASVAEIPMSKAIFDFFCSFMSVVVKAMQKFHFFRQVLEGAFAEKSAFLELIADEAALEEAALQKGQHEDECFKSLGKGSINLPSEGSVCESPINADTFTNSCSISAKSSSISACNNSEKFTNFNSGAVSTAQSLSYNSTHSDADEISLTVGKVENFHASNSKNHPTKEFFHRGFTKGEVSLLIELFKSNRESYLGLDLSIMVELHEKFSSVSMLRPLKNWRLPFTHSLIGQQQQQLCKSTLYSREEAAPRSRIDWNNDVCAARRQKPESSAFSSSSKCNAGKNLALSDCCEIPSTKFFLELYKYHPMEAADYSPLRKRNKRWEREEEEVGKREFLVRTLSDNHLLSKSKDSEKDEAGSFLGENSTDSSMAGVFKEKEVKAFRLNRKNDIFGGDQAGKRAAHRKKQLLVGGRGRGSGLAVDGNCLGISKMNDGAAFSGPKTSFEPPLSLLTHKPNPQLAPMHCIVSYGDLDGEMFYFYSGYSINSQCIGKQNKQTVVSSTRDDAHTLPAPHSFSEIRTGFLNSHHSHKQTVKMWSAVSHALPRVAAKRINSKLLSDAELIKRRQKLRNNFHALRGYAAKQRILEGLPAEELQLSNGNEEVFNVKKAGLLSLVQVIYYEMPKILLAGIDYSSIDSWFRELLSASSCDKETDMEAAAVRELQMMNDLAHRAYGSVLDNIKTKMKASMTGVVLPATLPARRSGFEAGDVDHLPPQASTELFSVYLRMGQLDKARKEAWQHYRMAASYNAEALYALHLAKQHLASGRIFLAFRQFLIAFERSLHNLMHTTAPTAAILIISSVCLSIAKLLPSFPTLIHHLWIHPMYLEICLCIHTMRWSAYPEQGGRGARTRLFLDIQASSIEEGRSIVEDGFQGFSRRGGYFAPKLSNFDKKLRKSQVSRRGSGDDSLLPENDEALNTHQSHSLSGRFSTLPENTASTLSILDEKPCSYEIFTLIPPRKTLEELAIFSNYQHVGSMGYLSPRPLAGDSNGYHFTNSGKEITPPFSWNSKTQRDSADSSKITKSLLHYPCDTVRAILREPHNFLRGSQSRWNPNFACETSNTHTSVCKGNSYLSVETDASSSNNPVRSSPLITSALLNEVDGAVTHTQRNLSNLHLPLSSRVDSRVWGLLDHQPELPLWMTRGSEPLSSRFKVESKGLAHNPSLSKLQAQRFFREMKATLKFDKYCEDFKLKDAGSGFSSAFKHTSQGLDMLKNVSNVARHFCKMALACGDLLCVRSKEMKKRIEAKRGKSPAFDGLENIPLGEFPGAFLPSHTIGEESNSKKGFRFASLAGEAAITGFLGAQIRYRASLIEAQLLLKLGGPEEAITEVLRRMFYFGAAKELPPMSLSDFLNKFRAISPVLLENCRAETQAYYSLLMQLKEISEGEIGAFDAASVYDKRYDVFMGLVSGYRKFFGESARLLGGGGVSEKLLLPQKLGERVNFSHNEAVSLNHQGEEGISSQKHGDKGCFSQSLARYLDVFKPETPLARSREHCVVGTTFCRDAPSISSENSTFNNPTGWRSTSILDEGSVLFGKVEGSKPSSSKNISALKSSLYTSPRQDRTQPPSPPENGLPPTPSRTPSKSPASNPANQFYSQSFSLSPLFSSPRIVGNRPPPSLPYLSPSRSVTNYRHSCLAPTTYLYPEAFATRFVALRKLAASTALGAAKARFSPDAAYFNQLICSGRSPVMSLHVSATCLGAGDVCRILLQTIDEMSEAKSSSENHPDWQIKGMIFKCLDLASRMGNISHFLKCYLQLGLFESRSKNLWALLNLLPKVWEAMMKHCFKNSNSIEFLCELNYLQGKAVLMLCGKSTFYGFNESQLDLYSLVARKLRVQSGLMEVSGERAGKKGGSGGFLEGGRVREKSMGSFDVHSLEVSWVKGKGVKGGGICGEEGVLNKPLTSSLKESDTVLGGGAVPSSSSSNGQKDAFSSEFLAEKPVNTLESTPAPSKSEENSPGNEAKNHEEENKPNGSESSSQEVEKEALLEKSEIFSDLPTSFKLTFPLSSDRTAQNQIEVSVNRRFSPRLHWGRTPPSHHSPKTPPRKSSQAPLSRPTSRLTPKLSRQAQPSIPTTALCESSKLDKDESLGVFENASDRSSSALELKLHDGTPILDPNYVSSRLLMAASTRTLTPVRGMKLKRNSQGRTGDFSQEYEEAIAEFEADRTPPSAMRMRKKARGSFSSDVCGRNSLSLYGNISHQSVKPLVSEAESGSAALWESILQDDVMMKTKQSSGEYRKSFDPISPQMSKAEALANEEAQNLTKVLVSEKSPHSTEEDIAELQADEDLFEQCLEEGSSFANKHKRNSFLPNSQEVFESEKPRREGSRALLRRSFLESSYLCMKTPRNCPGEEIDEYIERERGDVKWSSIASSEQNMKLDAGIMSNHLGEVNGSETTTTCSKYMDELHVEVSKTSNIPSIHSSNETPVSSALLPGEELSILLEDEEEVSRLSSLKKDEDTGSLQAGGREGSLPVAVYAGSLQANVHEAAPLKAAKREGFQGRSGRRRMMNLNDCYGVNEDTNQFKAFSNHFGVLETFMKNGVHGGNPSSCSDASIDSASNTNTIEKFSMPQAISFKGEASTMYINSKANATHGSIEPNQKTNQINPKRAANLDSPYHSFKPSTHPHHSPPYTKTPSPPTLTRHDKLRNLPHLPSRSDAANLCSTALSSNAARTLGLLTTAAFHLKQAFTFWRQNRFAIGIPGGVQQRLKLKDILLMLTLIHDRLSVLMREPVKSEDSGISHWEKVDEVEASVAYYRRMRNFYYSKLQSILLSEFEYPQRGLELDDSWWCDVIE